MVAWPPKEAPLQSVHVIPFRAVGPRLVLAALAALLLISITAVRIPPAQAQVSWCWNDPTLIINGRVVHIDLGVPQSQVGTVTDSTLTVTVPTGVPVTLAAVNAKHFITRLRIDVELVFAELNYDGRGPVPVRAEAVINAPPTTATALKAFQSANRVLDQTQATGGRRMTITFDVE